MRDLKAVLAHFAIDILPSHSEFLVADLRLDSRSVVQHDVFVALAGHQVHGAAFIQTALAQGAACALVDAAVKLDFTDERVFAIADLEARIAELAHYFYQSPSQTMQLVGVTGTNGKSTTTTMIANLATACGKQGAVIGTLGFGQPHKLTALANTTPAHVDVARILAQLQADNVQVVAMEVSSHGLAQGRVAGCQFKVGVFTNLSRDHLDYHGDMASYAGAKQQLFTRYQPSVAVLNGDDEVAQTWLKTPASLAPNCVVYGQKQTSLAANLRYVWIVNSQFDKHGSRCQFKTSWGDCDIHTALYGEFNLYNLAAAFATLLSLGITLPALAKAAQTLSPVAGRMQAFSAMQQPTCVVDYAHTPDALAQALKALQQHVPGKVTCVFGCGGDRDKGKRPQMAAIAEQYADTVVITSDNPRSEDPQAIINDVLAGLKHPERAFVEADRGAAIRLAIQHADADSVVLVAGKGHEDYQIIGNQVLPFCDRSWVQQLLAEATA
ncbi:UDP-N-acetylmuramoyl-L-alanyl-D-glutamate--2,6-diaminopimelate ligase [Pseudoalteromonas fenneropenaei]|uniref:UDP-N-acetylmuramoyl-L-alanyl-D-glutamate--2,6-diaminopimelate ligase n=1 Tax=Pseudoalteromonas fenneropenaei TaxID=1737459 RepID=A0ABV7CK81_9GAMM